MAVTIDRTDLTTRLSTLWARRPALALRAAKGDAGARADLDQLDRDIAGAERDLDILAAADVEAGRLATIERESAAADERRRLEAAYVRAEAARLAAYRQIEDTLAELGRHALAAETAAAELDRLGTALGRQPSAAWQFQARSAIKGRISNYFWTVVGWVGPMPVGHYGPLVDDADGAA